MYLSTILVLLSAASFVSYGIAYFTSPKMKSEFKRFGLEKFGSLTAILEMLGGLGLLVGLKLPIILTLASFGLTLLMFLGIMVRIKVKDSLLVMLPAIVFMLLNAYIFFISLGS
jgi:uncharacterized membrane protein YphA (DoxX/SURF4 family)